MRIILLSFFTFLFACTCFAQNAQQPIKKKHNNRYLQKPEFPGGEKSLYQFLADNVKYPQRAIEVDEVGIVLIRFVVQKDGVITNVELLRGVGFGMDEEAVRTIKSMPRWKPARYKGKPIPYIIELPIEFKLL